MDQAITEENKDFSTDTGRNNSRIKFNKGIASIDLECIGGTYQFMVKIEEDNLLDKLLEDTEEDTEEDKFLYRVIKDSKCLVEYTGHEYVADIPFGGDGHPTNVLGSSLAKQFEDNKIFLTHGDSNYSNEPKNWASMTVIWLKEQFKDFNQEQLRNEPHQFPKTLLKMNEIEVQINEDEHFLLDPIDREVRIIKQKFIKGRLETISDEIFIGGCPLSVEVHQSPLNGSKLKYKMEIMPGNGKYPITIEAGTISSILGELKESNLILKSYNAEDRLAQLLYTLHRDGYIGEKFGIDVPGFFCHNKKIMSIGYECDTVPPQESIVEALDILEEFGDWFDPEKNKNNKSDQKDKVATLIKLGLTLPFNYVRKQRKLSQWIIPPMAYGKPGSSKTTLFLLPAYLFGLDFDDFEKAGSNVGTEARFAEHIGKSTFPVMIDECQNVFMNKYLVEINKTGLRTPIVRSKKTKHGTKIDEPAYGTYLYISNFNPLQNSLDGTVRRYYILHFEEAEYKDEELQAKFDKKWKLREPDSPLKKLSSLGRFAANKIIANPDLLHMGPKELGDKLIKEIYEYANRSIVPWMREWAENESIYDYHRNEEDMIIECMHKSIMDAYTRKIQVVDEDGRYKQRFDNDAIHDTGVYKSRFWDVANERVLPWFFLKGDKDSSHTFYIKRGFADQLEKLTGLPLSLKSIGQKLGWEYSNYRDDKGDQAKMLKIPSKDFYDKLVEN